MVNKSALKGTDLISVAGIHFFILHIFFFFFILPLIIILVIRADVSQMSHCLD